MIGTGTRNRTLLLGLWTPCRPRTPGSEKPLVRPGGFEPPSNWLKASHSAVELRAYIIFVLPRTGSSGEIRTPTGRNLGPLPLPVGLRSYVLFGATGGTRTRTPSLEGSHAAVEHHGRANWCSESESNERPSRLQRDALPAELPKHLKLKLDTGGWTRTTTNSGLSRVCLPVAITPARSGVAGRIRTPNAALANPGLQPGAVHRLRSRYNKVRLRASRYGGQPSQRNYQGLPSRSPRELHRAKAGGG